MTYRLTENQIKALVKKASERLADYCEAVNIHYVVTGSSGGLDSAVTLALAHRACEIAKTKDFNLTSVALILPCDSCPEDAEKGILVAQKFRAKIIEGSLDMAFKCFMENIAAPLDNDIAKILVETDIKKAFEEWSWAWSKKVAQGNVKARLRMIAVYHTAKMLNGMVLSTDNLSEFFMAFWTICGDVGDFNMIQNVFKGMELYDIARYLEVPEIIIQAKPGDGLKVAGSAEDQLGADYRTIDTIMIRLIQQGFDPNGSFKQLEKLPDIGIDPLVVEKVARRCLAGQYKRRGTITIARQELGLKPIEDIQP